MFIPQAQPHAQSLFLFPIVFGINLIHFFDISTRKNGAAGNSIVCFAASIPCQSRHLTVRRMRTVSKSATFLATESVNSAPFKRGETEVQIFWQGIAQNSSSILRCTFLARKSAKLIANFSATMVTSLPSFSLSLSVSLSLSHRMYLTHNIGSAYALPIIMPPSMISYPSIHGLDIFPTATTAGPVEYFFRAFHHKLSEDCEVTNWYMCKLRLLGTLPSRTVLAVYLCN